MPPEIGKIKAVSVILPPETAKSFMLRGGPCVSPCLSIILTSCFSDYKTVIFSLQAKERVRVVKKN